jgi:hypothetical protein
MGIGFGIEKSHGMIGFYRQFSNSRYGVHLIWEMEAYNS